MSLTRQSAFRPGLNLVEFDSQGETISGLLFIPNDYDHDKKAKTKYAAMVVTRPASGVKEQTAGLYAEKFYERGYVALTFDPRGYGASGGNRRGVENPFWVIEDTKAAMTYLASLDMVDTDKLINTGVCMGAGYALASCTEDERSKACIAISPYLTAHIDYPRAYGGKWLLAIGFFFLRPLTYFFDMYFPIVPIRWYDRCQIVLPVQDGMRQYYGPGKPGDVHSWNKWGNFYLADQMILGRYNPFNYSAKMTKPLYEAYAEHGYTPELLNKFGEEAPAKIKQVVKIESANHFDLYYKPQFTNRIADEATAFLQKLGL